jgi:succinyl-CoA synthetase alpha subunit
MSILINENTHLLVQGITGHEGLFHTGQMINYGTNVVAGVTPGKGGEWVLGGKVPVFDSVKAAVEMTGANTSVIFVPAVTASDSIYEAIDAGIPLIVCITEGIPVQDMIQIKAYLEHSESILIGPNTPGIITPNECKVGIIPANISTPGEIGIISRSGTLTYELLQYLKNAGIGVSSCVGIGGDTIVGSTFIDILERFEADPLTEKIILLGEIGGADEEKAAEFIARNMTKPVVAFVAGLSAPAGKRMGHTGAIIEGGIGQAKEKIIAFEKAGVKVAKTPEEIVDLVKRS